MTSGALEPKEQKENEQSVTDRALNAAIKCFKDQGVSKTNMGDVARAAGMARSTLYRHFKDRDELVISVIEREALQLTTELMPSLQQMDSMEEFILEGTLLAIKEIEANPILSSLVQADAGASNHLLLATNRLIKIAVDITRPALEDAQRHGLIRENLKIEQLADWILRVLISLLTVPSEASANEGKRRDLLRNMLLPALFK